MKYVLCAFFAAASVWAQSAALLPMPMAQFFDNNGLPLAGGLISTFAAGTTTNLPSFTDSSGTVANTNPVVLNSSGRANIWLSNVPYKIVVKTSTGVTIYSVDNVLAGGFGGGGGGGGGTPWLVSGSTIYNGILGSKVCIASTACTTSLALLNVAGTSSAGAGLIRIDDTSGAPGLDMYAAGSKTGTYSGGPGGLRLLSSAGDAQMTVTGGNVIVRNAAAAGATNFTVALGAVQGTTNPISVKNAAGTSLTWIDPLGRLVVTSPLNDSILSATGGVTGNFLIAKDSLFLLSEPEPGFLSDLGQARIYYNVATGINISANGGPYLPIGGGGGGGGGSPGGLDTYVQFNNSGTFAGSPNFTWTGTVLGVTGTMQASTGFNTAGSATNAIQAPNGGSTAKWLTATDSVFWLEEAAPALSPSGQARMYMDNSAHGLKVSQNGGTYVGVGTTSGTLTNGHCVQINATGNLVDAGGACTTGGGGGTVSSGLATEIGYYATTGTTISGSTLFTWDNSLQRLVVTAVANTAGIGVANGYVQADVGFQGTSGLANNFNAFDAPTGGMHAKSFTSINYIQAGNSAGVPPLTTADSAFHPGAMYWDTTGGVGSMQVFNGTSWLSVATGGGGGGGVTTAAGAPNRISVNGDFTGGTHTGAVTLSLPQDIGTSSPVTFGSVVSTVFNSTAVGGTIGFQINSGFSFQVNGNGDISSTGNSILRTATVGNAGVTTTQALTLISQSNTAATLSVSNGGASNGIGILSSGGYGIFDLSPLGSFFNGPVHLPSAAGPTTTNGNIGLNPGNVTGLSSVVISGRNNSNVQTQALIINDIGGSLGSGITMKHGGTFDASWQAGTGAAFDVVTSASTHALIVFQNGHWGSLGSAPSSVTCTGGSVSVSGTDTKGLISVGSTCTGFANVVATFASAYTATPTCIASLATGGTSSVLNVFASTTQLTIQSQTGVGFSAGAQLAYICIQ